MESYAVRTAANLYRDVQTVAVRKRRYFVKRKKMSQVRPISAKMHGRDDEGETTSLGVSFFF